MRQFVLFVVLIVVAIAFWKVQNVFFQADREELAEEVNLALHEIGQTAAKRSITLVGPCLDECKKLGLSVRREEFSLRAEKVCDLYKPPYEWEDPGRLIKDISTDFMIVLARRARPAGDMSVADALMIARKDANFKRVEQFEKLVAELEELRLSVLRTGSWKGLELSRQGLKSARKKLWQELGRPAAYERFRPLLGAKKGVILS